MKVDQPTPPLKALTVYYVESLEHLRWLRELDAACKAFNLTYSPTVIESECKEAIVSMASSERFGGAEHMERTNRMYMLLEINNLINLLSKQPKKLALKA